MYLTTEELEAIKVVKYRPAVSLILSFEPNTLKEEMQHKLKIAEDNVKRQLLENYPERICIPVLQKLQTAISSINFNSLKKSIVIFVSPIFSKTFHLEVQVEDKIIIDESFEIRDLVYARQESLKYLVLLITGRQAKAFIGNNDNLIKVKLNLPGNTEAYDTDSPERVQNFPDPSKRKEKLQEKFLRHVDNALTDILKTNKLPVFLMGVERLEGHFKRISVNANSIIKTVHGNYEDTSLAEIKNVLKPFIAAWKLETNRAILAEVEQAFSAKKLDTGIEAVWESVNEKNGRLLMVEKNFIYPADLSADKKYISKHEADNDSLTYLKDAVDEIIEKVILFDGEIRFVDEGLLSDYGRIALIRHY